MMAVKSWLRFDAVINLGLVMPSSRRAWMNIGKSFEIVTMMIFYENKHSEVGFHGVGLVTAFARQALPRQRGVVMIIMDIIIRLADANNLVTVFNLYFNVILSLRTQIVAF